MGEALLKEISMLRDRIANAEAEKLAQAAQDANAKQQLSAIVQSCSALTLGIEAQEDAAAHGDVTSDFTELASRFEAKQVFRFGRVHLSDGASAPACSRLTVQNDGTSAWPQTTVVVNVEGDSMGLPLMALGALEAGEAAEVELDLEVFSIRRPLLRAALSGQSLMQLLARAL